MLNQRQELFCQNILTGKSATEAAKLAGYSEKTAQEQSSRLLSNVIVCQRIATLQQAVSIGNIATVTKRKEILTELAQDKHKQPITAQDKVRAISELNKMEGDYAPEKHSIERVDVIFVIGKGYQDTPFLKGGNNEQSQE